MRHLTKTFFILFISALSVGGAQTGGMTGGAAESLTGSQWTLQQFGPADAPQEAVDGSEVTLEFTEDGRVAGSSGCNRYMAGISFEGTNVTIQNPASTMMFCAEEGVMEQERAYLQALAAVERLELWDDTLRLSGGGQVLVYTRGGEAASGEGSGENETLQRWNALLDSSAARGAAWTKDPLRIALTLLDAGDAPEVRLERRDESAEGPNAPPSP